MELLRGKVAIRTATIKLKVMLKSMKEIGKDQVGKSLVILGYC